MRNAHKVLIVFPPHASFLLPERVLPYYNHPHPFLYQEVNDTLTGGVQVVVDLSIACIRDAFHLFRHTLSLLFAQPLLELLYTLVVPLVPRFYPTTVKQSMDTDLSA